LPKKPFEVTSRHYLMTCSKIFSIRTLTKDLVSRKTRFSNAAVDTINRLNDRKGWTFEMFAEKAREFGV
jgi:hypothetical protein